MGGDFNCTLNPTVDKSGGNLFPRQSVINVEDRFRGPGIWKLNCSLLSDEEYVERINSLIPTWVEEGKKDLKDPRSV